MQTWGVMPAAISSPVHSSLFDIVALGEAMVEFNQTGESQGRAFLQGFGGDTSNFAIAAARQGARVAYVSAVGNDPFGHMLRALWTQEGVDHRWVSTDDSAPTGVYFVSHDANGHHFHFYRSASAASRLQASSVPTEAAGTSRVCHLSGISLAISASACEAGFAWMRAAREAGARVSLDTNLRLKLWSLAQARETMSRAIALSHICLPSYDDMVSLTGLQHDEAIIDYCLGLGAEVVALKVGARGAWVANGGQRHHLPPHPCHAADATGAGDTFGGALVARLLAGDDLLTAGRYANVAAALSTEGYGAVAPIPHADRVRAALASA